MKESKIRVQFDMLERDIQALVGEADLLRHRVRLLWEKGDMNKKPGSFGEAMCEHFRKGREMSERTIKDDIEDLNRRVAEIERALQDTAAERLRESRKPGPALGFCPYNVPHGCTVPCPGPWPCLRPQPYSPTSPYPTNTATWRYVSPSETTARR